MNTVGVGAKERKKAAEDSELKKELKAARTENTKLKKTNEELKERVGELEAENKRLLEGEPEEDSPELPPK